MKNVIKINQWAIVITALLYLTFWGGILCQMLLGLFHIIIFIRILIKWNKTTLKQRQHLVIYGSITSTLLIATLSFPEQLIGILWIGSFPLIVYFAFILNQLKTFEL